MWNSCEHQLQTRSFYFAKIFGWEGIYKKKCSKRDSVDIWWLALIDIGSLFANPSSDWLSAQHERFLNGFLYPTLSRLSSTKAVWCSMYIFPTISWWKNNAIWKKEKRQSYRTSNDWHNTGHYPTLPIKPHLGPNSRHGRVQGQAQKKVWMRRKSMI